MSLTAPNRWAVLGLVCVAQFMVILDATIVNVALPTIERGLHFSPTGLQWIVNAYTLVFGGFLLLGGRAADLFGTQRLFIAGLVLFTGASLVNGIATSSGMLVGGPNADHKSPPARQWLDIQDSYTTNEIAINWNAPLVFILAESLPANHD